MKEAAVELGVSGQTVRNWCDSGELTCVRLDGRDRAILKEDVKKRKNSVRDFFSWCWRERDEFMIRVRALPCPDCKASGVCSSCDGVGCDDCVESPDWGDCVRCDGYGDYFVRETVFGYWSNNLPIYKSAVC